MFHRLITKADRAAARHIPPDSKAIPHPRGIDVAVVYITDKEVQTPLKGPQMHYSAVGYAGTAAHPSFNFYYRTPEQRAEKIREFFEGVERHAQFRAERRAARKAETSPFSQTPKAEVIYITTAATACELRNVLKAAFPQTKFSVRSSEYSMGSSIDVSWTDGPTHAQVNPILDCFESAGFDGMQDLKTSLPPSLWRGHRVRWGADYVHGSRHESFETLKQAALVTAFECDLPLLEIVQDGQYSHAKNAGAAVPWCTYKKDDGSLGFAHNSHRSESYDQLVYQFARSISWEKMQPVALPQRITEKSEPRPRLQPDPQLQPQPGSREYDELRARVEMLMQDPRFRTVN